ncbi:MAG: acyl-CoA dehydrogenase family protein [Candidatus Limnocylindrales bacterium]
MTTHDRAPSPFRLTEAHEMLRDAVRVLADERIAPRAAEIDRTAEFPEDLRRLLADHDILALPFPEEHGGLGGELLTDLPGHRTAQPCVRDDRSHPGRAGTRLAAHHPGRHTGATGALVPAPRVGGAPDRVRPDRGGGGIGRGGRPHEGDPRPERLRHRWRQALHQPRLHRGSAHGLRGDRPRGARATDA